MKKNIALLAGGFSGEYGISVQSAETVQQCLNGEVYQCYTIFVTKQKWYYLDNRRKQIQINKNDFTIEHKGEKIHFDIAFLMIHGSPGEDGKLQGYLEMLQIPYVGCGVVTSALTFNKGYCNKVIRETEVVSVASSVDIIKGQSYSIENIKTKLRFPVFVKPAEGGSSLGISKVTLPEALPQAIRLAFENNNHVLVEEYIRGKEISSGVYKTKEGIHPLPLTEIRSENDFFDFEAKYDPAMAEEITPAPLDEKVTEKIQQISLVLFERLNCRGIVRFDYIVEEATNEIYFLEVNTIPGQSAGSIIPKQIRAAGIELADIYHALIEERLIVPKIEER